MKCVLDSSVALKWVLTEPDSDKALRLRDSYRLKQIELIAPDWFVLEVTNVLGKAAARQSITEMQAIQARIEMNNDGPILIPSLPLVDVAFKLALQHRRAVYDLLYLALALDQKCELVTADDSLVRQLQPIYGCLVALSSLP